MPPYRLAVTPVEVLFRSGVLDFASVALVLAVALVFGAAVGGAVLRATKDCPIAASVPGSYSSTEPLGRRMLRTMRGVIDRMISVLLSSSS